MKKAKKVKGGRPVKGYVKFRWSAPPDVLQLCRDQAGAQPCPVSDRITALVKRGLEAEKGKAA